MTFATPLLLIGLAAAAIPFVLHLMSSVRAQEVQFPTLRFLKASMEKTARRRRIQHWLLMLLRAGLLALLALAVAEPISRVTGGWLAGRRYAAAVVLDNSYSMAARSGDGSRLDKAKTQAAALLGGDDPPTMGALLTTNGGLVSTVMNADLSALRKGIEDARIGMGPAPLAQRVSAAVEMLAEQTTDQKSVYVLSDLQRISFEQILTLQSLADDNDVHLLVVNTAAGEINNVGISNLELSPLRVVGQVVEITATLVNSSPADRVVDVGLRIDGVESGLRVRKALSAAGREGSIATVRFFRRFAKPGPVAGEVFLAQGDDLPVDNVRRFALDIRGRVRALVVRGAATPGEPASYDPAMMLRLALDPFDADAATWSIQPRTVEADKFSPADLADADIAFFCEVARFDDAQAAAIVAYARAGGVVAFFLGPGIDAANYNERFIDNVPADGGLLPGRIESATGEVGPDAAADAVDWVDTKHPYFEGLFTEPADYLSVLVQRHYRISAPATPPNVLMRLEDGDPLLVAKTFGRGRSILCTTTASPRWSNLPVTSLFLPMVARMSMLSGQARGQDLTYLAGAPVTIRPAVGGGLPGDGKAVVHISPPEALGQPAQVLAATAEQTAEGLVATFHDTQRPGVYRWQLAGAGPDAVNSRGIFAVNPNGIESRLASMPAATFVAALRNEGFERAYVASSLAAVNAAAAQRAQGRNWWDVLLAAVILLLIVEAVAANRLRQGQVQGVPVEASYKAPPAG